MSVAAKASLTFLVSNDCALSNASLKTNKAAEDSAAWYGGDYQNALRKSASSFILPSKNFSLYDSNLCHRAVHSAYSDALTSCLAHLPASQ